MEYKGYRILATDKSINFYNIDEDEMILEKVLGVEYYDEDDDVWYSVVGEDNWVQETFDTVEEAKEYIDEETK